MQTVTSKELFDAWKTIVIRHQAPFYELPIRRSVSLDMSVYKVQEAEPIIPYLVFERVGFIIDGKRLNGVQIRNIHVSDPASLFEFFEISGDDNVHGIALVFMKGKHLAFIGPDLFDFLAPAFLGLNNEFPSPYAAA